MNTDRIVEIILRAKDTTANVIGQFRRRMQGVTRVVRDVTRVVVASTAAMVGMVAALGAMASRGSTVLAVQTSFVKIFGDQEVALKKLREASYGLVTDFDLMQQANRAVTLGAIRNIDEFAELTRLAQALGDAQGIKLVDAQNRLVEGMGKANAEILQGIGLNVSMRDATEAYARSVGKSVAQLSQAERQEAFRTMAMEKARAKLNELGEAQLNAGDSADALLVAMKNLKDEFLKMAAESPEVARFFDMGTEIVSRLADAVRAGRMDIVADIFRAVGGMAGNAFGWAFFEAASAVFDKLDRALLPKFLEERIMTPLGMIAQMMDGAADKSADAARAWRAALISAGASAEAAAIASGTGSAGTGVVGSGGAAGGSPFDIVAPGFRGAPGMFSPEAIAAFEARRALRQQVAGGPSRLMPGSFGLAPGMVSGPVPEGVAAQIDADTIRDAGNALGEAGQVATASMFSAAEAMVRGSGRIEESIISMVTNIARSLPGIGGMAGVLIGGIGGLIGAAVGRNREAVPVRIRDIDDGAARKWQNAGQPIRVVTITEVGGVEVERIERELIARSNRDEVVRYRAGAAVGVR